MLSLKWITLNKLKNMVMQNILIKLLENSSFFTKQLVLVQLHILMTLF